jgi:hypothetical protein
VHTVSCKNGNLETVSRDFQSLVFSINQSYLDRWNSFSGVNDTTETINMVSQWWQSEKLHRDINYRIFLPNFSCVNYTAEISNRLYNRQVLFLPLKGKSSKNISMPNIPILYCTSTWSRKSCGLPRPHFRFLAIFESIISANTNLLLKNFPNNNDQRKPYHATKYRFLAIIYNFFQQ